MTHFLSWGIGSRRAAVLAGFIVLSLFVGCEQAFQPLQQNDRYYFSLYGYLDAAADTQWIRVSPAREQVEVPALVPEMTVTLEELSTGRKSVMNDSLFYEGGNYFINSWSTMDLSGGETYRLTAEDREGNSSEVTVTLPEDFPTPRLRYEFGFRVPDTYTLFVEGVEQLIEVETNWYVNFVASGIEEKRTYSFNYRNEAVRTPSGTIRVPLLPEEDERKMNQSLISTADGSIEVVYNQVFVASAGPEWDPSIINSDDLVYALPDGFSNVKNGLGYVVGIYSKWIPYRSCYNEQRQLIACPEEEPFWP